MFLPTYHPHIDGLRAISVLAVVFYHAKFSWVPGGFVGVDIFFVISGYLIVSQIATETQAGNFSFSAFWARRTLRILPPFALVLSASILLASAIFVLPSDFHNFGREVSTAALMISNFRYLRQGEYFAPEAETLPLLHTWSLGVEEQFYLLAPLTIVGVWWILKRTGRTDRNPAKIAVLTSALFIFSLLACIYWTPAGFGKNKAFYLMPFRAWEFVAGGALGLLAPALRELPNILWHAVAVIGLTIVAYSITVLDNVAPYPSYVALAPVLGSSFLILSGLMNPRLPILRLLSAPILVWIGLVSYSWYLWHWPLLVLGAQFDPTDDIPFRDTIALVLSFALAVFTYRLVERPIREWRKRGLRLSWRTVAIGAATSVLIAASGLVMSEILAPSLEVRFADEIRRLNSGYQPGIGSTGSCLLNSSENTTACLNWIGERQSGFLTGDSHAGAFAAVLSNRIHESGQVLALMLAEGCVPLSGLMPRHLADDPDGDCGAGKKSLDKWLMNPSFRPRFAVIAAHWQIYLRDDQIGQPNPVALVPVGDDIVGEDAKSLFISSMRATIEGFFQAGVDRVVVIGQVPAQPSGPNCLLKADVIGKDRDKLCSLRRSQHDRQASRAAKWISAAIADFDNVHLIEPAEALCDREWCRAYSSNGYSYYLDNNHLNALGANLVFNHFSAELDWAVSDTVESTANR